MTLLASIQAAVAEHQLRQVRETGGYALTVYASSLAALDMSHEVYPHIDPSPWLFHIAGPCGLAPIRIIDAPGSVAYVVSDDAEAARRERERTEGAK